MNQTQSILSALAYQLRSSFDSQGIKKALGEIEKLHTSFLNSSIPWTPEIVSEIVIQLFGIYDSRELKRSRLKTGQRLHLAEIVLSFLSASKNDIQRKAMFSTIFPPYCLNQGDVPLLVLSLVTSLAIVARDAEVLQTISLWMMSCGVDNPSVLYIAGDITKDLIQDENPEKYNHLPRTAFLFTSILLYAIGKTFQTQVPPSRLIAQITSWIETCPSVCYIPPRTSLFDIYRWILVSDEEYPRLQWTLLDSISHVLPGMSIQVIPPVMKLIHGLKVKFSNLNAKNPEVMEKKTELLCGLIVILIGTRCLDWNEIHPLLEEAENAQLPKTRQYKILEGMYSK